MEMWRNFLPWRRIRIEMGELWKHRARSGGLLPPSRPPHYIPTYDLKDQKYYRILLTIPFIRHLMDAPPLFKWFNDYEHNYYNYFYFDLLRYIHFFHLVRFYICYALTDLSTRVLGLYIIRKYESNR